MDSALVATSSTAFIGAFKDILSDNFSLVLAFMAGILVWVCMKYWVFGSVGMEGGYGGSGTYKGIDGGMLRDYDMRQFNARSRDTIM